jgi:hypothetical protein
MHQAYVHVIKQQMLGAGGALAAPDIVVGMVEVVCTAHRSQVLHQRGFTAIEALAVITAWLIVDRARWVEGRWCTCC